MALTGVVLELVALTFDASPLFVLGTGFVLLGVGAPAWVWLSAQPVALSRRLGASQVVEGEPLEAMVSVRRGVLGLPGAELHDPLATRPVVLEGPLSLLRGSHSADVRIITRFARRGLRRIEPPTLVIRDPLELASISQRGRGKAQELLVLPYTERPRWVLARVGRQARRATGRSFAEPISAVDVDGLRPYRPGTPASRIHWPALARGAGLLERRLRADRDTRPMVVLDPRGSDELGLDAAVRAAASLTLELARRGGCRLLLPGERRPLAVEADLGSWPAAHIRLALVQGGPEARPPMLGPASRLGPVYYVAAQPLDRLPVAISSVAAGAMVIVLPKSAVSSPPGRLSFEVTGCQGFVVESRSRTGEDVAA